MEQFIIKTSNNRQEPGSCVKQGAELLSPEH